MIDNFEDKLISNVAITEVETENDNFTENVKNVLNRYTQLSVSSAILCDLMQNKKVVHFRQI